MHIQKVYKCKNLYCFYCSEIFGPECITFKCFYICVKSLDPSSIVITIVWKSAFRLCSQEIFSAWLERESSDLAHLLKPSKGSSYLTSHPNQLCVLSLENAVVECEISSLEGENFQSSLQFSRPTISGLRSFSRKYCIPSDIRLNSISSHLTDSGFLIISGSRFGWRETHIMAHPPSYETYTAAQVPPSNVYNPNLMRGSHRGSIISQV